MVPSQSGSGSAASLLSQVAAQLEGTERDHLAEESHHVPGLGLSQNGERERDGNARRKGQAADVLEALLKVRRVVRLTVSPDWLLDREVRVAGAVHDTLTTARQLITELISVAVLVQAACPSWRR